MLAFWTAKDAARMEALFGQSGLVRDKWKDRPDYRERTIRAAIDQTRETFDPLRNGRRSRTHRSTPRPDESQASSTANDEQRESPRDEVGGDGTGTTGKAEDRWPMPQPLIVATEPADYPLDALPKTIHGAVKEVAGFVKAPIALVASSALSVISTACQTYKAAKYFKEKKRVSVVVVDVARADTLSGPVSLFTLTIADSGERKTTCDNYFSEALRNYDRHEEASAAPELDRHKAEFKAWRAESDGIQAAIREAAKAGDSIEQLAERLEAVEAQEPKPLRVPKLIRGDDTPESLAFSLATKWPSAGIITAEAGIIFGAHAMGPDSAMRNLALLNILWDGGELSIERRTSESFTLRGARLSMGLQVQEGTLRTFFDKSKGLARNSGWLARFLVAWPRSTQGERPYSHPPEGWPHLTRFNARISDILNMEVQLADDEEGKQQVLSLSTDAKAAWITFHDAIEKELRTGGELFDVRDVASKTADNAARLAALFHMFEHELGPLTMSPISLECFEGASRIAAWHLNESRRFFGELAFPPEIVNASRLDAWLIECCRRSSTNIVPRREVQQYGPNSLREKTALNRALKELMDLNRVRMVKKEIHVNPGLLP
jgi:putative DNA primase/helicase